MRVGVVLQARMGSARLPGKTLRPILGRPMIQYVIERLKSMQADVFVLAVPDTDDDAVLGDVAAAANIEFYAGEEHDVLDRYYRVAERYELDHIYRATGDNPLVEAEVQDRLVRHHIEGGFEFTEDLFSLPHGLGGEAFSREGLRRCWLLSTESHQREGVNDYILEHRSEFRTGRPPDNPYPPMAMEMSWTVDTLQQFDWVQSAYEALYREGHDLRVEEVLQWVAVGGQHQDF